MKILKKNSGYTLLEVMVAMGLTAILATTGFEFYSTMHHQTVSQEQVSDMQQDCRATLDEISRTLRKAGYKTGSHPAYAISDDSLCIYFADATGIDTVAFFLAQPEYDDYEQHEYGGNTFFLMKQENDNTPVPFSELVTDISFTALSATTIEVTVEVQADQVNEHYAEDDLRRTYQESETVTLRNVM